MQIRNLSIFIVDDRPVSVFLRRLYDVNATPYGWVAHCMDAAEEKQLVFDLLSSDVNYSEDMTDPAWSPALKGKFSCWGLVHALTVLARRNPMDDEGNVLPLEWEIRSAAPQLVSGDVWATRLYGLLRSLAAQPEPEETLSDCIKREHLERWNRPLETSATDQVICSYPQLFSDDLAKQDPQDSDQESMVDRLLPSWRSKLLAAVKDGRVRLHLRTLERCARHLRLRSAISVTDERDGELCIPFSSSATGDFAYGINLFSVLGDLFSRDQIAESGELSLDTTKKFDALRIDEPGYSGPVSIAEWFDHLRVKVKGVQTPAGLDKEMLAVAAKLEDCLGQGDDQAKADALQDLLGKLAGEYTRMGILYILLVARRQLLGFSHTRQAELGAAYHHISIGTQTFSRPIRSQAGVFPQIGGPDKLGREICNAMSGRNHRLGAYWAEWIKPGLSLWYDEYKERLDPSGKNVGKFSPGLQSPRPSPALLDASPG